MLENNIIFESDLFETTMKPPGKYRILYAFLFFVLFSVSGLFLYGVVFRAGGQGEGLSFHVGLYTCLATVVAFNIWGFSLLSINGWLSKRTSLLYRTRRRLLIIYLLSSIALLLFSYGCFILIKWISGATYPSIFALTYPGSALLQAVWFIETVVFSLFLVEFSSRRTIELYKKKQLLEKNAMQAQYLALQNQLNPHFLFNNLSVLTAEIEYDPQNAVLFVQNLSDIYRYVLQQQDKMRTSLHEELNFFDAYLFLYQTRYGTKLHIINNIPERAHTAYVPPLTLQMLVENALKHNYMTEESPMTIRLDTQDNDRQLRVSNTLQEVKNSPSSGRGLTNLSMRFSILCGQTIEVQRTETEFIVITPLLYE